METVLIPATTLIALALAWLLAVRVRAKLRPEPPRARLKPVLDEHGRACLALLRQALPERVILPAVGFSRFLTPQAQSARAAERLRQEMQSYYADFLICDSRLRVLAVITLNKERTPRAETLLREAAVPLLRYDPQRLPSEEEVRETFQDLESLGGLSRHLSADQVAASTRGRVRREPRL